MDLNETDFDRLQVGQVIKEIEDRVYPHLTEVGDRGTFRDASGRIRADYEVIKTYRDPYSNEVKMFDARITRVYPKEADYLIDPEESGK